MPQRSSVTRLCRVLDGPRRGLITRSPQNVKRIRGEAGSAATRASSCSRGASGPSWVSAASSRSLAPRNPATPTRLRQWMAPTGWRWARHLLRTRRRAGPPSGVVTGRRARRASPCHANARSGPPSRALTAQTWKWRLQRLSGSSAERLTAGYGSQVHMLVFEASPCSRRRVPRALTQRPSVRLDRG
jgi:hypothetical protein